MDASGADFAVNRALLTDGDVAGFDIAVEASVNLDVAICFDVACYNDVASEN